MINRELKRDPTLTSKPLYFLTGLVSALMLLCGCIAYYKIHDPRALLTFVAVAIFLPISARIVLRSAMKDLQAGGKWWLTDDGLQRRYPSESSDTITWQQIRHMKWVGVSGLIVRWEESKADHQHRSASFRSDARWDGVYRQYRALLRIYEADARELIAIHEATPEATKDSATRDAP